MTIRFAVLGAGRIGKVHARAIGASEGARLVAVFDPVEASAVALATAWGAERRSIDAILASDDIDAIAICTPTDTHADLIERGVRAGKAIFCEKPVDLSVARVRQCLDVVAAEGGRLMVGFNRRFDPHFRALKAAIDEGAVGRIEMITITSRDPGPPPAEYIRSSGGIFKDMTIHDLDMARFLLGEEIAFVSATGAALVDPAIGTLGDFDSASLILETASGRQCLISNSRRAAYGYDQRVEVLGETGMIAVENQRPVSIEIAGASGFTRPPLHDFFMTRYVEAYAAEIATFIAGLTQGTPLSPTGQDGLQALVLAEAALRSVQEGRRVATAEIV
ncbi:inositol 2-dehydrogenase [Aureimonas frigidaquae]|uniref:Myo-inositol 2-dehydrogenase n=1 Tax=Aureimonas frigidaquae TaxID=424757 RepID=A0A0P0Z158_9HYPH|nr:inositol 2-dehydrogenase [Aureimonas frigidaquae]BAT27743.1 myo-inositol 2-dehydrogenase [Aureimonas frigidaquae]